MSSQQQAALRSQLLSGAASVDPLADQSASATEPPRVFLTGKEASAYLWENYRLQRSERRLAQLRVAPVGAGPPFHRDGCAVRYRRESLDTWALKQLGPEHASTSDESAFHQRQRVTAG